MKLSIVMLTLAERNWKPLYDELVRQILPYSKEVELVLISDNGEATSGVKRQRAMNLVQGEYVCSVDDDDQVASDYVSEMLAGCKTGKDVVTFHLCLTRPGRNPEVWKFGLYPNQRNQGKMMVNHLCAWKTEIARKVAWCPSIGYADDQLWMQPLFHAGLVTSEHHINRVLYHYLFHPEVTSNQRSERMAFSRAYVADGLRCFKDAQGEIWVELGGVAKYPDCVCVRDKYNRELMKPLRELTYYHTIRIA